jgi:putative chitinase
MLSLDRLKLLFPRASGEHTASVEELADEFLDAFRISRKPLRWQFFLAQLGHESGGLSMLEENLNYSAEGLVKTWPKRFASIENASPYARKPERIANLVYANRMGNGSPESGDGWRFRGRGYIQLTGRDAYRQVGAITGLDLEAQPELALDPGHAFHVVCGFWNWKKLNEVCDTGDYLAVTKVINGGTHGQPDREAWLDKVRRVFADPLPLDEQPPADELIAIQRALQLKGYTQIGAADGDLGPRTIAAITSFRMKTGLPKGLIDAKLRQALGITKR